MSAEVEALHSGPGMHELVGLANLVIVFLIVYFGARKGILGALKSRADGIEQKLNESKVELAKVTDALNATRAEFKNFENTRNRMIAEMRSEAEHLSHSILEEAKLTADRILEDAKISAKNEARGAASGLKQELVNAALVETQNILAQSKDQQSSLHKQFFDGINDDIKGAINGR
ncbi:MAG: ATP synthase F0 subunit B [Bdellovibrionota bacterium]